MKKIYVLFILSFSFCGAFTDLFAQGTFQRIILSSGGCDAYCVRQTTDGGYILATNVFTTNRDWEAGLIKTDKQGNTVWNKTYGGADKDYGYSVMQTGDGGYLLTGTTKSFGTAWDLYAVRTNANGDTLWTKAIGGTAPEDGYFIKQTADGGFIITGDLYAPSGGIINIYLIKLDASGTLVWSKTYGGAGYQSGICISQTSDSGYVICGYTTGYGVGGTDAYVIRVNANGDTLWTKTYGTAEDEGAYFIEQTPDKGFIITGDITYAEDSHNDIVLMKTDSSGNLLWTKSYGGFVDETPSEVHRTTEGGYIIIASTNSFGAGSTDAYLIKTTATGDTLWSKTYGGNFDDGAYSGSQTDDGGYILTGYTNSFGSSQPSSAIYLVKTDANGNDNCYQAKAGTIIGTVPMQIASMKAVVSSSGTGKSTATIISNDAVDSTLCLFTAVAEAVPANALTLYPNPVRNELKIMHGAMNVESVQIYNVLGKEVFNEQYAISNTESSINVSIYPCGLYFVRVTGEKGLWMGKFIKE